MSLLRLFSRRKAKRLLQAWNEARQDHAQAKSKGDTRRQHQTQELVYAAFHAKLRHEVGK